MCMHVVIIDTCFCSSIEPSRHGDPSRAASGESESSSVLA